MPEQAKTRKIKRGGLWWAAGALAVALLLAFGLSSYLLQSKAGGRIAGYVKSLESASSNPTKGVFYCLLPSLYELPESADLDQAIEWLNKAKSLAPWNGYSSFLLGQTYCLKGEYQKAVDAFDDFFGKRPDNRLAKAEAGFANFALSRSTTDSQIAQQYQTQGLRALESVGFSNNPFIKLGDESFRRESYSDSLFWYETSFSLFGQQDIPLFRYALLQLVFQGSSAYADQVKNVMALEADGDLTIEPSQFFLLSAGSRIQTREESDRNIGILYSNSQDAGILLDVSEANQYCVLLQALDRSPAPTQIGVEVDFEALNEMNLVNGDNGWVQFEFEYGLDPGLHILSLKLMNDAIIGGSDRNAYFGSITIEQCK